jgi:hypothetical protein
MADPEAGNSSPRHRKRRKRRGTVEIIDELLLSPHWIRVNGKVQRVSTLEAIMLQLLEKAYAGDNRAWQVLLKYEEFARRRAKKELALQFVDSDYTRAFASSGPEDGDG